MKKRGLRYNRSNSVKCSLKYGICSNIDSHKATAKYMYCSCSNKLCNRKYKIMICSLSELFTVQKIDKCTGEKVRGNEPKRGISAIIKPFIDKCFEDDFEMTAKKCSIKIYEKFEKNKSILPSYKQVNFISMHSHIVYDD